VPAGVTGKSAPLALVPKGEPPMSVVYHLIESPSDVAFRFDFPSAQIVSGVAITKAGTAGELLIVRSDTSGSLVITGLLDVTLIL